MRRWLALLALAFLLLLLASPAGADDCRAGDACQPPDRVAEPVICLDPQSARAALVALDTTLPQLEQQLAQVRAELAACAAKGTCLPAAPARQEAAAVAAATQEQRPGTAERWIWALGGLAVGVVATVAAEVGIYLLAINAGK